MNYVIFYYEATKFFTRVFTWKTKQFFNSLNFSGNADESNMQLCHFSNSHYSTSKTHRAPSWMFAPKVDFFKDSKKRPIKVFNSIFYKSFTWKMKETSELYKKLFWIKSRIMYFANNWIYTTNHKRIAINYFFFVLFSGTCGMALATIIRLEMAYPGVGILAGDSLQYLSIVTAHAVIMVFFMIMPLLLGAYSNFLLPTQLGVHDVAFPRLNSAAFWFLPAGLIMLAQLVCLDRRYQRMNCFNMRELQALLKEKYFNDLVNNYDYRSNIFNSLNLKYKLNDLSVLDNNLPLFNNNSVKLNYFNKVQNFNTVNNTSLSFTNFNYFVLVNYSFIQNLTNSLLLHIKNSLLHVVKTPHFRNLLEISADNTFGLIVDLLYSIFFNTYYTILNFHLICKNTISQLVNNSQLVVNFYFQTILNDLFFNTKLFNVCQYLIETNAKLITNTWTNYYMNLVIKTEHKTVLNDLTTFNNTLGETIEDSKALRFNNPIFKYDYKLGNYLSKETINNFPHLMLSQTQVTGGIRKSSYIYSAHFTELFKTNLDNYLSLYSANSSIPVSIEPELRHSSSTNVFYNLFLSYNTQSNFIDTHWTLNNTLNQKFYKIFLTSSMQQRVYSNWRQLKFSREAWRCKLLAARHQKTLYHRYVNEDGVFWSVERNAKDVLPGWAMITPFSARTRFTAIGKVDIGLMGVFIVINSSIVSSANFLVTYRYLSTLNNKKRRDARSFYTEGVIVASWMMIAANPMLAIGILMLLSDRHWQTSFFDYSGGGDTVLFQHMFWFFGHPEVYIIMIPAFGFVNTILSFYLRKRVSARASLLYSMYTIAFLGFFVWGHHMYMVGLAHTTRMLFSTLTVMISVPAATKLMHWCVTLVNSSIQVELPLLYAFLFVFFFVSGGISGMAVAHTGMDVLFHDTFYVVGHFHVMLAGAAMFGAFGGLYFYFPAIFGVKFSRTYAYIHLVYYLLGQLMTVIPMFWLGYSGMPRRVLDYPAALGGWHAVASAGHLLSVAGMVAFFIMIFDSLRQNRAATRNSFGISRFNTRLNFYLYETSKMLSIQRKCWYISRHESMKSVLDERRGLINHELNETASYSYVLIRV